MRTELLRFNSAVERDPAIAAWMKELAGELGAIAHQWHVKLRPGTAPSAAELSRLINATCSDVKARVENG